MAVPVTAPRRSLVERFLSTAERIGNALPYSPEFAQLAQRIGDSTTNTISPMMSYFALMVECLQKCDPKGGIGTVIATMLPYTVTFLVVWSMMLVVWMLLGLPIGRGAGLHLSPG
jgi:aminobenzoyl-glutamate transport protein